MNLKIPCTSCSDWQPSSVCVLIACFIALLLMLLLAKVKVDVFRLWPFSLKVACSCCFSALDMDHCSSQLKSGEHPEPSTHKHTTDPDSLPAHTDSNTNVYPLTQANTKLNTPIIIALSFSLLCSTMILECTFALSSFTFCLHWTEYTHKLEKEKRRYKTEACNQKLKLTLSDWAYYKPVLVSLLFCPLHFVGMFSLSLHIFFFSSTTALHKHEKGSCSAISAIQASRDQGFNQKTVSGPSPPPPPPQKKKDYEELMEEGSNRKP